MGWDTKNKEDVLYLPTDNEMKSGKTKKKQWPCSPNKEWWFWAKGSGFWDRWIRHCLLVAMESSSISIRAQKPKWSPQGIEHTTSKRRRRRRYYSRCVSTGYSPQAKHPLDFGAPEWVKGSKLLIPICSRLQVKDIFGLLIYVLVLCLFPCFSWLSHICSLIAYNLFPVTITRQGLFW